AAIVGELDGFAVAGLAFEWRHGPADAQAGLDGEFNGPDVEGRIYFRPLFVRHRDFLARRADGAAIVILVLRVGHIEHQLVFARWHVIDVEGAGSIGFEEQHIDALGPLTLKHHFWVNGLLDHTIESTQKNERLLPWR